MHSIGTMGIDREITRDPFHAAVRWIDKRRRLDPKASPESLTLEAGMRFELPPVAREMLWRTVVGKDEEP